MRKRLSCRAGLPLSPRTPPGPPAAGSPRRPKRHHARPCPGPGPPCSGTGRAGPYLPSPSPSRRGGPGRVPPAPPRPAAAAAPAAPLRAGSPGPGKSSRSPSGVWGVFAVPPPAGERGDQGGVQPTGKGLPGTGSPSEGGGKGRSAPRALAGFGPPPCARPWGERGGCGREWGDGGGGAGASAGAVLERGG
ncbi:uncharacterized protein LOC113941334 [Corapipo altera]|uniref:uncharacterized protein LOC113941334 n=1 Tax=Corapipo altera TaxID=415028 RepID=UPI000FD64591|nr:uncharacterized protein LOC113941334 [Corapipo altera]